MKKSIMKKSAVLLLTVFAAFSSVPLSAAGWELPDSESFSNGRVIEALILTARYKTPYRLAFIAQRETKVPVILLPAADSVDRNIYLCIPDGKDAVVIPPAELSKYISFINARKVIVLGGPDVVDPGWRAAIEAVFPVQDIDSDNFYLNAVSLSNALQCPAILKDYQKLLKQDAEKKAKKEKEAKEKKEKAEKETAAREAAEKKASQPGQNTGK